MTWSWGKDEQWIAAGVWRCLEENEEERTGTLRLSAIGKCERRLWAQHHGKVDPEQIEGRILDLFGLGHKVEAHVVELLRAADFTLLHTGEDQESVFMYLDDYIVRGHPDGRILLNGEWCILEIKSANEANFFRAVKDGIRNWRPEYWDQAQGYMGATGLDACLFIVYSKNSSNWHVEKFRFDPDRFQQLRAKAEVVRNSKDPPPRGEEYTKGCYDCRYCHAAEWCYGPVADVTFAE